MPIRELLSKITIQDIKKNTLSVVILLLICSNIYFINLSNSNTLIGNDRLDKANASKDSIAGKYFDALIAIKGYKELLNIRDETLLKRDSLLRERTEKPAKQIINSKK